MRKRSFKRTFQQISDVNVTTDGWKSVVRNVLSCSFPFVGIYLIDLVLKKWDKYNLWIDTQPYLSESAFSHIKFIKSKYSFIIWN